MTGSKPDAYRDELFERYGERVDALDPDRGMKVDWFDAYASANYLPLLKNRDRVLTELLEIGCSRGYLLEVLKRHGFLRLHGVDLSPVDVLDARAMLPDIDVICGSSHDYLENRSGAFDVILLKAVLEHVPKADVLPMLRDIAGALRTGGIAIVDVPNMDWLFASHERYMDFTHEGGFTKESLRQTLGSAFHHVEVVPVETRSRGRRGRLEQRAARWILEALLKRADPEGAQNPIWARSIIGVGHK